MYQAQMQYRPVIMNRFDTPYQMNYQPIYFPQAQAPFISTSNGMMVGYMQPSNNGYHYQSPRNYVKNLDQHVPGTHFTHSA